MRRGIVAALAVIIVVAVLLVGCEQPEDVLTPLSSTGMWLNEQLLPSTFDSMSYELWLADYNITGGIVEIDSFSQDSGYIEQLNLTRTYSLGKFKYDHTLKRFLEIDGSERLDSNFFYADRDILEYRYIMLSLETDTDSLPDEPGPIMLVGETGAAEIRMRFPKSDSLWESIIWYNMETCTDASNAGSPTTDGAAVWFSTYAFGLYQYIDTFTVKSWTIDSNTFITDTVIDTNIIGIDSTRNRSIRETIGLDVLTRRRVDIYPRYSIDTVNYWTTSLELVCSLSTEKTFRVHEFNQGDNDEEFQMPDPSPFGWKYKGWVVSPVVPVTWFGRFTPPAWTLIGEELAETDGGLISTGKFTDERRRDDADPYIDRSSSNRFRRPNFPGEDFLYDLPWGNNDLQLVPGSGGNPGRVFITLEPDNFVTDTTNFPLLVFSAKLPENRDEVINSGESLTNRGDFPFQQFIMRGWMNTNDPFRGMPKIIVNYQRN